MLIWLLRNCFSFPTPPLPSLASLHIVQKSILQTVPEAENERPEVPQRMSNTRFWWNSSLDDKHDEDFCTINVWIRLWFPFSQWLFPLDNYEKHERFLKIPQKRMLTLNAVHNTMNQTGKTFLSLLIKRRGDKSSQQCDEKYEKTFRYPLSLSLFSL